MQAAGRLDRRLPADRPRCTHSEGVESMGTACLHGHIADSPVISRFYRKHYLLLYVDRH